MRFQETNDPGTLLELDSKACYPANHGTVTKYLAGGGVLLPAAPSPDHDWDDNAEEWVLNQGRADEAQRVQDIQEAKPPELSGVTIDQANSYINSTLGNALDFTAMDAAAADDNLAAHNVAVQEVLTNLATASAAILRKLAARVID